MKLQNITIKTDTHFAKKSQILSYSGAILIRVFTISTSTNKIKLFKASPISATTEKSKNCLNKNLLLFLKFNTLFNVKFVNIPQKYEIVADKRYQILKTEVIMNKTAKSTIVANPASATYTINNFETLDFTKDLTLLKSFIKFI